MSRGRSSFLHRVLAAAVCLSLTPPTVGAHADEPPAPSTPVQDGASGTEPAQSSAGAPPDRSAAGAGDSPGGSPAASTTAPIAGQSPEPAPAAAAAGAAPVTPAAAPAAKKPVTLYGRIEEISTVRGAQLPVELRPLVPKMDDSLVKLRARANQLKAQAQQTSFPVDWSGTWSGRLTVWSTEYSPLRYQIDAAEAKKEQEIIRRGASGDVTFQFTTKGSRKVQLAPAKVIFTASMSDSRYSEMIKEAMQQQGVDASSAMGAQMFQLMQQIPVMYAFYLGNLEGGVGVTGNELERRVIKNDVRELAQGVLEQSVVSYYVSRNPTTGARRTGFDESVVRFTRQSNDQLYVQAATVSYLKDGRFADKVVLYGTVRRGAPSQGSPAADPLNQLLKNFPFPR